MEFVINHGLIHQWVELNLIGVVVNLSLSFVCRLIYTLHTFQCLIAEDGLKIVERNIL